MEGALEYEVEKILNLKIKRRKLWYMVNWKGYEPEERTWEPTKNLTHTDKAIAAYYQCYSKHLSSADIPPSQSHGTSAPKKGGTVTNDTSQPARRRSSRRSK